VLEKNPSQDYSVFIISIPLVGKLLSPSSLGSNVRFITGGAGFSFNGPVVRNLGGGIKFRLSKRTGLLAEYRYFNYPIIKAKTSRYVGAGLTYSF